MGNVFADFLLESGLYDEMPITQENIEELYELIGGGVKIDAFCKSCGEKRVFTSVPVLYTDEEGRNTIQIPLVEKLKRIKIHRLMMLNPQPGSVKKQELEWNWLNEDAEKDVRLLCLTFICSMDESHYLDYAVLVNKSFMRKIGQYPSVADMAFPELEEYKKSFSKEDLREFRRAIGLYSQNIGVGSYVYLRRILERLIGKAREMAGDAIDTETYAKSKVVERIKLLKGVLPSFLVENAAIYGIVSKGIHELTEEECLQYFPVLKGAIVMIVSQWEQERKMRETEKTLSKSISQISQTLK